MQDIMIRIQTSPTRRPDPAAASPGSSTSGPDTRQPGPRRHPPPGLATSRGPCTDGLCRHDTHADAEDKEEP